MIDAAGQPDRALLDRHRAAPELLRSEPGRFTNWLGLSTRADLFPGATGLDGAVFADAPIPDDRVYGGAAEYCALLSAIEAAPRDRFVAVELGAAWAPWISAAGIVCAREGREDIRLVGVEACGQKVEVARQHLSHNGLDALRPRVLQAAAWSEDTTLWFPRAPALADYGARASIDAAEMDYRGLPVDSEPVKAMSVETICEGLDTVDYMHWDIQGAEEPVAQQAIAFLTGRVRQICIGTHSRRIEGVLLELFHRHGWVMLWERACGFHYDPGKPSVEGMTHTDGEQVWRNPLI